MYRPSVIITAMLLMLFLSPDAEVKISSYILVKAAAVLVVPAVNWD